MITAVDFISLEMFNAIHICEDMAVVSIGWSTEKRPDWPISVPALRLEFLDLTPEEAQGEGVMPGVLATHAQLQSLIDFTTNLHADPKPRRMVVHCFAGVSRSAAAALVVHAVTQCDFPRQPDAVFANTHVLQLSENLLGAVISLPCKAEQDDPTYYRPPRLLI